MTTVAGKYLDFAEIGAACLRMVARNHGVELSEDAARKAVAPMRSLPPHADVVPALGRLRDAGFRLFTLTNSSKAAVADQMKNAGLTDFFEALLSVEDVGKYKPHAEVYRWAAGRVGADVSECLLVAAHGWDVAGAAVGGDADRLRRPSRPADVPARPDAGHHDPVARRTGRANWNACSRGGPVSPPCPPPTPPRSPPPASPGPASRSTPGSPITNIGTPVTPASS